MRHPEEHNKLAVDPDTSWIIEKIFDLAAHGAGAGKIARTLTSDTSEKIPTPGYFNYKKYGLFSKFYDNASAEKSYTWTISTVRGILSDETYIGNSVHGKQTTRLILMKSNCYPDCLNQATRKLQSRIKKQSAELAKAEKRKAEVDRLFTKMYEDWSSGRITEYNFKILSQKYQAEQQELIEKIDRLKTELASEKQPTDDAEKWIVLIKQYSEPTELTAEMLNTLIEKIVVHEATKEPDGTRT